MDKYFSLMVMIRAILGWSMAYVSLSSASSRLSKSIRPSSFMEATGEAPREGTSFAPSPDTAAAGKGCQLGHVKNQEWSSGQHHCSDGQNQCHLAMAWQRKNQ